MSSESADRKRKIAGVEASATELNAVCLDSSGSVTASRRTAIEDAGDPTGELIKFIRMLPESFGDFEKIGIAVPGLIHRESRRVAYSAHIPSHSQKDLAGEIKSATGLTVVLENDANAAAYGEFLLGAGRGSRNMFYATLGTGVGGAFIVDGRVWHGVSGFAGEFGYVAVNSDGMRLEDVASAANIVRRTRNRFHQDSTSSLNKIDEQAMTINDIIAAAENEDDFAQLMLERTGTYVGIAIASVINLLNLEKIVIGGEIMRAQHLVLDAIVDRARELSFAPSFESTTIVEGELGSNASAIGAALLADSN